MFILFNLRERFGFLLGDINENTRSRQVQLFVYEKNVVFKSVKSK